MRRLRTPVSAAWGLAPGLGPQRGSSHCVASQKWPPRQSLQEVPPPLPISPPGYTTARSSAELADTRAVSPICLAETQGFQKSVGLQMGFPSPQAHGTRTSSPTWVPKVTGSLCSLCSLTKQLQRGHLPPALPLGSLVTCFD